MKKVLIVVVLLFTLFILTNSISPEKRGEEKMVAGIEVSEYERILPVFGPLDRLYCSGDICYFIVQRYEVDKILSEGYKIKSLHSLPGKKSRVNTTYHDINGTYHNYNETLEMLTNLSVQYPEYTSLFSIGESVEGRGLYVLKISDNAHEEEDEPNVYIVGCHHAREWISVEIPLLFAQHILENMVNDPEIKKAIEGTQIYILPILNPDGLEFTILNYRYWRKNRKYNGNLTWGVDLNRNYSYMWGYDDTGSSSSDLSNVYRGPSPFSEPETFALKEFMTRVRPAGVLSYHNYSQLILYPWGYINDPPEDFDELDKIGKKMRDLMFDVNGREYTPGSGSTNIYNTNGGMIDWVYGTFRVPAYTIELPPEYSFEGGFYTTHEEILPTFNENLPAMIYFINYFIDNNFPSNIPIEGE